MNPAQNLLPPRFGVVVIVGPTNVGKSTLVNELVKEKVSIVTNRVQTTIKTIRAVLTRENCQILFLDAPGFLPEKDSRHPLVDKAIGGEIHKSLEGTDAIIWMISGPRLLKAGFDQLYHNHFQKLKRLNIPLFLAVNKMDRLEGSQWGDQLRALIPKEISSQKIFFLSASLGKGVFPLLEAILTLLPLGPFLFDPDLFTPHNMRELCCERIRKFCFHVYGKEIPYRVIPEIETYCEEKGLTRIEATLYYDSPHLKPLLLGKGGCRLKKIGTEIREFMERLSGEKIYFRMQLKLKKNWQADEQFLSSMGLNLGVKKGGE